MEACKFPAIHPPAHFRCQVQPWTKAQVFRSSAVPQFSTAAFLSGLQGNTAVIVSDSFFVEPIDSLMIRLHGQFQRKQVHLGGNVATGCYQRALAMYEFDPVTRLYHADCRGRLSAGDALQLVQAAHEAANHTRPLRIYTSLGMHFRVREVDALRNFTAQFYSALKANPMIATVGIIGAAPQHFPNTTHGDYNPAVEKTEKRCKSEARLEADSAVACTPLRMKDDWRSRITREWLAREQPSSAYRKVYELGSELYDIYAQVPRGRSSVGIPTF